MRKSLSKLLKTQFAIGLKRLFPNATSVRLDSGLPSSIAWRVDESKRISTFVVLAISPRDDRFAIELALSSKHRIPEVVNNSTFFADANGELRFRLSRLWQPNGFETWYDLQYDADYPNSGPYSVFSDEVACAKRIPLKIDRALEALRLFGIPYFAGIAR